MSSARRMKRPPYIALKRLQDQGFVVNEPWTKRGDWWFGFPTKPGYAVIVFMTTGLVHVEILKHWKKVELLDVTTPCPDWLKDQKFLCEHALGKFEMKGSGVWAALHAGGRTKRYSSSIANVLRKYGRWSTRDGVRYTRTSDASN